MKRALTAAVALPLAVGGVLFLPQPWFLMAALLLFEWVTVEYVRVTRIWAPHGPQRLLLVFVPLAMTAIVAVASGQLELSLLTWSAFLGIGMGLVALFARTPMDEAIPALGVVCFGIPYLAVAGASIVLIRQIDPFVLLLLLAIIWAGDSAAYWVGKRFGRHKLAPIVSPKKTWEGAIAGLVASTVVGAVAISMGPAALNWQFALVVALTAVAGQLGDLVESILKRGAGIKDSGHSLPGHGGMLDRLDALLFAAPVFLMGLHFLRSAGLAP